MRLGGWTEGKDFGRQLNLKISVLILKPFAIETLATQIDFSSLVVVKINHALGTSRIDQEKRKSPFRRRLDHYLTIRGK